MNHLSNQNRSAFFLSPVLALMVAATGISAASSIALAQHGGHGGGGGGHGGGSWHGGGYGHGGSYCAPAHYHGGYCGSSFGFYFGWPAVSLSFGFPVYAPAPVYYEPAPVVYAPAPVVYAPAPRVVYVSRPVQETVYVERAATPAQPAANNTVTQYRTYPQPQVPATTVSPQTQTPVQSTPAAAPQAGPATSPTINASATKVSIPSSNLTVVRVASAAQPTKPAAVLTPVPQPATPMVKVLPNQTVATRIASVPSGRLPDPPAPK